jgi:hypothetical protein
MAAAMDLPIICTLSEEQLRDRRREILEPFRSNTYKRLELPDGYAYMFQALPGILEDISRLVDLERQCCHFLTFKIVVEPQQLIRVEITGRSEAKPVIADFFGSSEANT